MVAAAELWNLRIVVVESRHYEFLASDNSEEIRAARGAHIKEIANIYKVALSKLDCVKDDYVQDLDGGDASRVACLLKVPKVLVPCLVPVCAIKQEGKGDVFQGHLQCLFDVGV